jgi:hypothetical protein
LDISYALVDQRKDNISPDLRQAGGKRPDFFGQLDNESQIVIFDAKCHLSDGGKSFSLTDDELTCYQNLLTFMSEGLPGYSYHLFFMLFPKEMKAVKLVWVPFTDFAKTGQSCILGGESAKKISLTGRDEDWMPCENLAVLPQPGHLKSDLMQECADMMIRRPGY